MATKKLSSTDKQIQDLFEVVKIKKAEIEKAEKPVWETNCSFRYDQNSASSINLHTISDVNILIDIYGFLILKESSYKTACTELGIPATREFKWQGYTINQWKSDIRVRINKIEIGSRKSDLDKMEAKLNSLLSPELKAKLELEDISKSLGV